MSRYALIDESGAVVNVIELEADSDWQPPEGMMVVQSDIADIGWRLDEKGELAPVSGARSI